jgi:cobalt-zinc-cadmium resistance protein CzcA
LYTLNDLKALQDWTLEREFLRVPRIGGVVSFGGTTKRYEVRPDPDRLKQYGITLPQLQNAISASNANVGGGYLVRGHTVKVVRSLGLIGKGQERLRENEELILDIPVDLVSHTVTPGSVPSAQPTPVSGAGSGVSPTGTSAALPSLTGSTANPAVAPGAPRRRLRDLVTAPAGEGEFTQPGASMIYREQGRRMVAVKFGVRGRDLAGTVAEAQEQTRDLFQAPYQAEWSGEFQEMEQAERRLLLIVPQSLGLIVTLLYLAFHSALDVSVVLVNVLTLSLGGIWALLVTGTNFSISAAVGFISIFGVAVMNGLLLVSSFNHLRGQGVPLREALVEGVSRRARPLTMTVLTAILGLLPAALSTRIGSQTQRPLAIVVVGGMLATLLLTALIPVLYSFYGHREPPSEGGGLAH